jgi:hypothetical protein
MGVSTQKNDDSWYKTGMISLDQKSVKEEASSVREEFNCTTTPQAFGRRY